MTGYEDECDDVHEQTDGSPPTAVVCIIEAAWAAAVTPEIAEALARPGQQICLLIVPDTTWIKPISRRLDTLFGSGWVDISRDGTNRTRDRPDVGNDDVVALLAKGKSVVGIASSKSILPSSLLAAADISIELDRPDNRVVAAAIQNFLVRKSAPANAPSASSLDLFELAACFRRPGSARSIIERVNQAQAGKAPRFGDDIPQLDTALEWGAARDWGLSLASQVAAYQRSEINWADVDAGALLHSKPGLGKTTYCASLARRLGAKFIATSISELFANSPGYLDSVIKALRDVYRQAEQHPGMTVIMFDEIDALPTRVGLDSRSASWWTSVITELLMLTAIVRPGVVQIACTNFVDRVDPALRRPGRFGRVIEMEPPGPDGVVSMARHQLRGELADADLALFGQLGAGMTAAEIMAAVRGARTAARHAKRELRAGDLVDALIPQDEKMSPDDLHRVAVHESGHATVGLALGIDDLLGVQIGGGSGMGSTRHRRRSGLETRQQIENRATMMLGGRAAETLWFEAISDGSNGDLMGASKLVTAIHGALGLGETLFAVDAEKLDREVRLDPALRRTVEQDLRRLQTRANDIVRGHRKVVEQIAAALEKRRHLTGDEARKIFAEFKSGDVPAVPSEKDSPEC